LTLYWAKVSKIKPLGVSPLTSWIVSFSLRCFNPYFLLVTEASWRTFVLHPTSMPSQESLYFVAIIPPEPIRSEVEQWKQYFKEVYQSKAALNSPPHITLHMPFRYPTSKEGLIEAALKVAVGGIPPFPLSLHNFGAFPPRVIFVEVEEAPLLRALQKEIVHTLRRQLKFDRQDYRNTGFHPHMTLAFRDLKKPAFAQAWEGFSKKSYQTKFDVDKVVLLRHSGKVWVEHLVLPLITQNS
jgi:2'-5' RNA ligase